MSTNVSIYHADRAIKNNNSPIPGPMSRDSQSLSDWAILNSMDTGRLRRLLQLTDGFVTPNIEQASDLIKAYQAVYRRELMKLRRQGCLGQCPPPTSEQLQQMAQILNEEGNLNYSAVQVLAKLQTLAWQLRTIKSKK